MSITLKVMICDDSLLIRKKLKDALGECGEFEILEAVNGQQAIDKYKEHKPDVVFMDIVLPEVNGIEALQQIREFDNDAKVVMVSSTGTQANLKSAISSGAVDFIQKPWQQSHIAAIIEKILNESGVK